MYILYSLVGILKQKMCWGEEGRGDRGGGQGRRGVRGNRGWGRGGKRGGGNGELGGRGERIETSKSQSLSFRPHDKWDWTCTFSRV